VTNGFTVIADDISRDVAAGIAILKEAGGLITTANPPADPATDEILDVRLGSRLYLGIRWVSHTRAGPFVYAVANTK
jgi:hypothetical protein